MICFGVLRHLKSVIFSDEQISLCNFEFLNGVAQFLDCDRIESLLLIMSEIECNWMEQNFGFWKVCEEARSQDLRKRGGEFIELYNPLKVLTIFKFHTKILIMGRTVY